ncbi:major facilitator superfamily domain-containing protein [Dichotomocladium elegans]|nr:major facilitator superfamily domain-containing protein [Dichotomocladium elegans]
MIRDFDITTEENIGYYAGLVTSSFAIAQLVSAIPWGMLSDTMGRRPVILAGTFGTMVNILLFGLSKSLAWALLARCLCGLLNGNTGVLKGMVSELTAENDEGQRARAFTYLPLVYGLGSIIGPMMGGLLSNPVKQYPGLFEQGDPITDFLLEFPYFLPCFFSALICAFSFLFGCFFLEETLKRPKKEDTKTPLLQNTSARYNTFDEQQQDTVMSTHSPTPTLSGREAPPTLRESITAPVIAASISYGLFSFQAIYYDELFPIWTASPRTNGGLGYRTDEIGLAIAYCGVITLISQLFFIPGLTKRYGVLRLYRFVLLSAIPLYFFQGFIRWFYEIPDFHGETETKTWVWVGIFIVSTFKTFYHSICFTSCTILVNNATPRMDALGTVNGFAQCCGNAMRAFGPAVCGAVWSGALSATWLPYEVRVHVSWTTLALVGLVTYISSKRLNPADYELSKLIPVEEEVLINEDDSDSLIRRRS